MISYLVNGFLGFGLESILYVEAILEVQEEDIVVGIGFGLAVGVFNDVIQLQSYVVCRNVVTSKRQVILLYWYSIT